MTTDATPEKTIIFELSLAQTMDVAMLAYQAWSTAYDAVKAVEAETDDGSPDWYDVHAERLKNTTIRKQRTKELLDVLAPCNTEAWRELGYAV